MTGRAHSTTGDQDETAFDDPTLYARSFEDVYDTWYGDLDDPTPLVEAFVHRCRPRATILELGSGTGRLAAPLAAAGFAVVALDASVPMLARAPSGPHSVAADMAVLPVRSRSIDAALIAYNTFFNLAGKEQQRRCLLGCARVLRPEGLLAIEAFVAGESSGGFGLSRRAHPTDPDATLAIVTGPADAHSDVIAGSHIEIGRSVVCRPWRLCYRSPSQLDELARACGLALVARAEDWGGTGYDSEALRHVSWYKRF